MPGYRGHITGGVAAAVLVLGGLSWVRVFNPDMGTALVLAGTIVLGALFPDVDTDSKGQNLFYSILAVLDLALIIEKQYQWAALIGLCAMFPAIGHHRGWTHTWWAMLLVPLPLVAVPWILWHTHWNHTLPYYLAFGLGYFSHLLLDRKF